MANGDVVFLPSDVRDLLTNLATHPHGIKVRLESRLVGRVKRIHS